MLHCSLLGKLLALSLQRCCSNKSIRRKTWRLHGQVSCADPNIGWHGIPIIGFDGHTIPPPLIVTVPANPVLHCATPLASTVATSLVEKSEGTTTSQIAWFKVCGDGARLNVPVAVNCTMPLGKSEAVAVCGAMLTETNWCERLPPPQAKRVNTTTMSRVRKDAGSNLAITHLRPF